MERKCRNCGAMIESSDLKVCPYCDSEITFEAKSDKSGTENTFGKTPDLLGISFELGSRKTVGADDEDTVAVNDVQTIKNYMEGIRKEGEVVLRASSPIYDVEWMSAANEDGDISIMFCKSNDEIDVIECNFEECLGYVIDFYEGRFNPSLI